MTGSLQIKNDKYYAVLNFHNSDGTRVQKWFALDLPVHGNKRRAEAKLHELLVMYQGFEAIEPLNCLLSVHIMHWLNAIQDTIAHTTMDQYLNVLHKHIKPYFDPRATTLSALTAGDLEDYYAAKIASGLSPNSVIKHHAIIRTALQWGVKHRYLRENVADFATKPTHVRYRGAQPYSVAEVALLFNATQNDIMAAPVFLACFYGLRRSEILGLRWSSIDFTNNTLTISTTVVRERHDGRIKAVVRDQTTKTDTSMRTLPLCAYSRQFFACIRARQEYQRNLCQRDYNSTYEDFVCVDEMGNLLLPDFVSQRFQKILQQYNLRHIRFHDLRHSCATIMLHFGYSLKDIQTWLGHSNYNFTADTYIHTGIGIHEQMANTFANQLGSVLPSYQPIPSTMPSIGEDTTTKEDCVIYPMAFDIDEKNTSRFS